MRSVGHELKRRPFSFLAATAVVIAAGFALVAVALAGGFDRRSSHVLYGQGFGVAGPVGQGEEWAAGGIPLCTTGHSPVVLTSITPVEVSGQVRLDRIVMRHVGLGDTIGLAQGVPVASHPAAGYLIHSPSPCAWPGSARMNEVVVLATRTGPYGGAITGLRVDYKSGGSSGSYVVPFTLKLCGGPRGGCNL
jgi:hypothetical protein